MKTPSLLKHRKAYPTILMALGTALLLAGTVGLIKDHLDLRASHAYQGEERGKTAATAPPSATPMPPTPIPTVAPSSTLMAVASPALGANSPTPTATASPTLRPLDRSGTTQAQGNASTPTPTAMPTPASAPPDRIVIPAIGLDAPVVSVGWTVTEEGAVWEAADYAAGWHLGSAYPGQAGNTVLSGHHNIKGKVFRYLIDLESGDEVFLYVGDTAYRYLVTETHLFEEKGKPEAVRRANAQWIAPTGDERVTLVTCWPYTSNTHRLIIVAKPYWKLETES